MSELTVPPYQNDGTEKIRAILKASDELAEKHKVTKEKKGEYPHDVAEQLKKLHEEVNEIAKLNPGQKQ